MLPLLVIGARFSRCDIISSQLPVWHDGEVETQRSAKPPCAGSIPARASDIIETDMKLTKKTIAIGAVVLALIAGGAFKRSQTNAAAANQSSSTVKSRNLKEELTLPGQVDASENVTLRFQSSGKLAYVGVAEGDTVKKGQLVASLDQRELRNKLSQYLLAFKGKRWDLDQARDDIEGKAITEAMQRVLDKSQFTLDTSVLDVELQSIALEYSRLIAPFGGIVTKVDMPYAGVNITPAQSEFTIINPDTFYFEAKADQSEVIDLKEGENVTIVLDSFSEGSLKGTIKSISFVPRTDESNTVYTVKISINPADLQSGVRVGMTGDATFLLSEKKKVLSLPQEFVKSDGDKSFVTLKKGNKMVKQTIKTGLETDTYIEITSGLKEGDVVYD